MDDGRVLVRCFAGCDFESILAAVGIDASEMFPPNRVGDHRPKIRKPWRVRDVIAALRGELTVAAVILSDVHAGKPLSDMDCERADVAVDRIKLFLSEL
jgi:hypothetical protein